MIKMQKDISFFRVIKELLILSLKSNPVYIVIFSVIAILSGMFFTFNTIVTNNFFDSISKYIVNKITFENLFIQLFLLCACLIMTQILNGTVNFLSDDLFTKIQGNIGKMLNMKSSRIDAIDYENPLFLDNINKAQEGLENGLSILCIIILIVMLYVPYFISMEIYLYKLSPILSLSIIIIFLPTILAQFIKIKLFTDLEDTIAPIRREYEYYEKCIIDKKYFKETRLLGCFSYFKKLYKDALMMFNNKILNTQKKSIFIDFLLKLLTLSGYIIVLFLLVHCVLNKSITVGAFGAVFGSLGIIISMAREVICMHIANIVENIGTVKNLIKFFDMDERVGKCIEITGSPTIDIKNVSFKYPGNSENTLHNISFNIASNETIAIVGENGSGKSTLVNLLIGIYTPTEGDVLISGYNTKNISMNSLFKYISGVFQKFQRYKMTLKDNISISDFNSNITDLRINEAIKKADFEVNDNSFLEGYNTMLSREFDGIDLSGGQWQRIAIARGFYKKHNLIVLDEPTAAIDPIEETKLYNKFKEMSKGKTSIIVTHRLGSAKIADKIIVLDKGNITQIGTHNELMKKNGKYKEMFKQQSKWYIDN